MIRSIVRSIFSERQRIQILLFISKLKAVFFLGRRHTCNCCGYSFRKFLDFGMPPRIGVRCPFCLSLERTRRLWLFLSKKLGEANKKLKVLHFAPEPILKKRLKEITKITYFDADINLARADQLVNIEEMPFEDNYFDLIICSHVLAHVSNQNKALSELYRVLIPQTGLLILVTKLFPEYKISKDYSAENSFDSIKRKHGADFPQIIAHHGFNIVSNKNIYFEKEIEIKYNLGDPETDYFVFAHK